MHRALSSTGLDLRSLRARAGSCPRDEVVVKMPPSTPRSRSMRSPPRAAARQAARAPHHRQSREFFEVEKITKMLPSSPAAKRSVALPASARGTNRARAPSSRAAGGSATIVHRSLDHHARHDLASLVARLAPRHAPHVRLGDGALLAHERCANGRRLEQARSASCAKMVASRAMSYDATPPGRLVARCLCRGRPRAARQADPGRVAAVPPPPRDGRACRPLLRRVRRRAAHGRWARGLPQRVGRSAPRASGIVRRRWVAAPAVGSKNAGARQNEPRCARHRRHPQAERPNDAHARLAEFADSPRDCSHRRTYWYRRPDMYTTTIARSRSVDATAIFARRVLGSNPQARL